MGEFVEGPISAMGRALKKRDEAIVTRMLAEQQIPASKLVQLLASIRLDKRSGLLEVYFNQGSPNGTMKFTERQKD